MLSDCAKGTCQLLGPPASCSVKHSLPLALEKASCPSSPRQATKLLGSPSERGQREGAKLERAQLPGMCHRWVQLNTRMFSKLMLLLLAPTFQKSPNLITYCCTTSEANQTLPHDMCLASCKGGWRLQQLHLQECSLICWFLSPEGRLCSTARGHACSLVLNYFHYHNNKVLFWSSNCLVLFAS